MFHRGAQGHIPPQWMELCVCVHMWVLSHFSRVQLCVTPSIVARQAPLSMGFSKKEYSGVGCHVLLQGIFPTRVSNLHLLCPALGGGFFTASTAWEAPGAVTDPTSS